MLALVLLALTTAVPEGGDSVFRIEVFRARPDWTNPWRTEPIEGGSGSGFLIAGNLVMTNAHVVADAQQVLVRRRDRAAPVIAKVKAVGHDCDLAVLEVSEPDFLRGLSPMGLGEVPGLRSQVTTVGYPAGGREVSSTAGIVSRVEMQLYVHSGVDAHVAVQTDAAINPGNSGGPVLQNGKVVGVAFQSFVSRDNIGYFIPTPVIRHFLDDLKDGRYDGFPDLGVSFLPAVSPALRQERRLPKDKGGVVVQEVSLASAADGVLEPGDVLLAIDGSTLEADGRVVVGKHRLSFLHVFDMKQVGQPTEFWVWRDGQEKKLTAPAKRMARLDRSRRGYDQKPRYLVYAGMVFMPLNVSFLETFGPNWPGRANRELVWHQLVREWEKPERADDEVVVLTRVFKHPVNSQMTWTGPAVVSKVNGRPLRSMKDLAQALDENKDRFHVFTFEPADGIEALDRAKADAAHPVILSTYGIPRDRNL